MARRLVGRDETCTIRPEHIALAVDGDAPGPGEIQTGAVVRDVQYLGAFLRVRTETDAGARLVVDVPAASRAGAEVRAGQRCTLSWRAEHVRAVGDGGDLNTTNTGRQA
jgi:hypothetical protein